jgi:putative transposase
MSTKTYRFACQLPHNQADSLNAESARIYNMVMVEHWRIYNKKGHWLSQNQAEKLNDFYDKDSPKLLHSHSVDAAQQSFYKACKQVQTKRKQGDSAVRYPYKRRRYRTTVWKATAIYKIESGLMHVSQAKGLKRLEIELPSHLKSLKKEQVLELRLVFNKATFRYSWHLVIEDGNEPKPSGQYIAGVDLGEIHPITVTDGAEALVISCRELRALNQYRNKRLAAIQSKLSKYQKGSRRWHKLQKRKRRFLAQIEEKKQDMEHKIARSLLDWAQERNIGLLAIGDVRDIADGKKLNTKAQQKISNWSHGTIRAYINYKAAELGIQVEDKVPEHYTSQTCPNCGHRHKPKGRNFNCPQCGERFHRDVVGAANIASRYEFGELGRYPAPQAKYRHPVKLQGKRSPSGTG